MDKKTLEKANKLSKDIRSIELVEDTFECKKWSGWGLNDDFRTTHFALLRNYYPQGHADTYDLPRELNDRILAVVSEYKQELIRELEQL